MTDDSKTDEVPAASLEGSTASELRRLRLGAFLSAGVLGAAMLVGGIHLARGQRADIALAPLPPTAIAALHGDGNIAAKGEVAEIFGNKFIVQDASGRALVDTGPRGDAQPDIVKKGETVQAQGRFDHGVLHAAMLTHSDGRKVVLRPPGPPRPRDVDLSKLTERVRAAGYQDVRIVGSGPRHVDVTARGTDGRDHDLHVDIEGQIRERGTL